MTTPVFLPTDETAFDDDNALTAEHGRRLIRNALAAWNERCGHVGMAEQLIAENGDPLSTRVLVTVGWGYVGPISYHCPSPTGSPNTARPVPTIRLLLSGRATGDATSYLYAVNEAFPPTESQMDADIAGTGAAWAEIVDADWSCELEVPVTPGQNTIWLGVKCGLYGSPSTLEYVDGSTTYGAYGAEYSPAGNGTGSSHPAVLAPQTPNRDVPAFALLVASSETEYLAGNFDTYTVPTTFRNPFTSDAQDGVLLAWEPFRAAWNRLRPAIVTSIPPWLNPVPLSQPIAAYTQPLDVLNLDSFAVDGSQVWQTEDYDDGGGLRWWLLPSAQQYRNAANLAEISRRAVCPMVTFVQEVTRGTTHAPYPLDTTGGKPFSWKMGDGSQIRQSVLLSLSDLPPFALPTDTVNLEFVVPVAALRLRSGGSLSQAPIEITAIVFDRITLVTLATATRTQSVPLFQSGDGGLDGFSTLARTIGWSYSYENDQKTQYGQEGLTLRGEWQMWTKLTVTVDVPRASISTNPVLALWGISIPSLSASDFIVATGPASVRIKGA
jgi:hypothetical protein